MRKLKRFFCLFLSVVILTTSLSVYNAKKVQSAEWVAGAVATIGGAPILSALLIGGTVIAGGIAIYELASSTPSDRALFVNGIKTGFQEFVTEIETNELLQNNANITEAEAIEQATATATETVADFTDNVLDQTITTGKNLKTKTVEYWQRFSSGINDVADNGLPSSSGTIQIGDILKKETIPNYTFPSVELQTICNNANPRRTAQNEVVEFNGNTYIYKGTCYYSTSANDVTSTTLDNVNFTPFIAVTFSNTTIRTKLWNYRRDTDRFVDVWARYRDYYPVDNQWNNQDYTNFIENMNNSNLPIIFGFNNSSSDVAAVRGNLGLYLGLAGVSGTAIPLWKRTVQNAFDNTHIGESIRTGRRQRINNGDYVGSIFQEDALPVKRSGLRVNNGVASGTVGWDIPDSAVWDGYLAGEAPFPRVTGDTGTVVVPKTGVTDRPSSNTVEWPSEADIYNPARDPDIGNPRPIGEPVEEIIEEQGGEFYPTAIDLTNIFPFCIPFDIAYCIGKFQTPEGTAPIIHIPIPIPTRLQGTIGQSYDVVIDFNDYIVIRNIIRYFILLFFIVALMGFTRNIIRG